MLAIYCLNAEIDQLKIAFPKMYFYQVRKELLGVNYSWSTLCVKKRLNHEFQRVDCARSITTTFYSTLSTSASALFGLM